MNTFKILINVKYIAICIIIPIYYLQKLNPIYAYVQSTMYIVHMYMAIVHMYIAIIIIIEQHTS